MDRSRPSLYRSAVLAPDVAVFFCRRRNESSWFARLLPLCLSLLANGSVVPKTWRLSQLSGSGSISVFWSVVNFLLFNHVFHNTRAGREPFTFTSLIPGEFRGNAASQPYFFCKQAIARSSSFWLLQSEHVQHFVGEQ